MGEPTAMRRHQAPLDAYAATSAAVVFCGTTAQAQGIIAACPMCRGRGAFVLRPPGRFINDVEFCWECGTSGSVLMPRREVAR